MKALLVLLAEVIPAGVLIGAMYYEQWRRKKGKERLAHTDKLLRPPGYTLQLRLEKKQEDLCLWFVVSTLAGAIFGTLLWLEPVGFGGLCIVSALAAAIGPVLAWRTILSTRPIRMGLFGEQLVAEQLQTLRASGYQVFHDLKGSAEWNIDHVVVGSGGVFAIETKSRTKKPGRNSKTDYNVSFDGKQLDFPWGGDADSPAQARRNAKWLSAELSKSIGGTVEACPLLVFPGWFVTTKVNSDLKVLNAKQIPGFVLNQPRLLGDDSIKRIAYQLEQRCRDVEY